MDRSISAEASAGFNGEVSIGSFVQVEPTKDCSFKQQSETLWPVVMACQEAKNRAKYPGRIFQLVFLRGNSDLSNLDQG